MRENRSSPFVYSNLRVTRSWELLCLLWGLFVAAALVAAIHPRLTEVLWIGVVEGLLSC